MNLELSLREQIKHLEKHVERLIALMGAWVECKERLPQSGRVLVFSPLYEVGDPTRFRVMDAQFVRISTDCTHWMDLDALAPTLRSGVGGCSGASQK